MKNRQSILYYSLIIIGSAGIIIDLGYDLFRPGTPYFGDKQFIGFIASLFILLAGFRISSKAKKDFWDFVFLFIYIAGMFYLVFKPGDDSHFYHTGLLVIKNFGAYDLILNVIGFMPLGYLLMSLFSKTAEKCSLNLRFLVISLIGVLLSFFIEIIQYDIPGRTSSLIDVVANGSGNLIGMTLFLLFCSISKENNS